MEFNQVSQDTLSCPHCSGEWVRQREFLKGFYECQECKYIGVPVKRTVTKNVKGIKKELVWGLDIVEKKSKREMKESCGHTDEDFKMHGTDQYIYKCQKCDDVKIHYEEGHPIVERN